MCKILVLFLFQPEKASYGVEDPWEAIAQLAQTTMRSEIGIINISTISNVRHVDFFTF